MFDFLFWRPSPPASKIQMPEPLFTKATLDAEIRLREIALKEKEMEVRRLEALAKLEELRKENHND